MRIPILGAGAMGAALTFPLAAQGHTPVLYGNEYDADTLQQLRSGRPHPRLKLRLPESVEFRDPDDLAAALEGAEFVILAVNTKGLLPLLEALLPHLQPQVPLITLAKGMVELDGVAWPASAAVREFIAQAAPARLPVLACLTGPSIAAEVARGVPTMVYLASKDETRGRALADALCGSRFHCRYSRDPQGVEICSAYKNIYTIALSWPRGMSEGEPLENESNLKAILFLQTLAELQSLCQVAGGDAETALGLAGLGDLVTTVDAGRNGAFGHLLGAGKSVEEAMESLADQGIRTVEGYETAELGLNYAHRLDPGIDAQLPLLGAIHQVLHCGKSVREAIDSLDLGKLAR